MINIERIGAVLRSLRDSLAGQTNQLYRSKKISYRLVQQISKILEVSEFGLIKSLSTPTMAQRETLTLREIKYYGGSAAFRNKELSVIGDKRARAKLFDNSVFDGIRYKEIPLYF